MEGTAVFSPERTWRYALYRIWDRSLAPCMFIGLNPSTADETKDDPTVRRCIRFAKDWGFGGLHMTNLYAFRATDPKDLYAASRFTMDAHRRVVGPENDEWLMRLGEGAGIIIAAWGADPGPFKTRPRHVSDLVSQLHVLALTKHGQPRHPLYLKADCVPTPWQPKWL